MEVAWTTTHDILEQLSCLLPLAGEVTSHVDQILLQTLGNYVMDIFHVKDDCIMLMPQTQTLLYVSCVTIH